MSDPSSNQHLVSELYETLALALRDEAQHHVSRGCRGRESACFISVDSLLLSAANAIEQLIRPDETSERAEAMVREFLLQIEELPEPDQGQSDVRRYTVAELEDCFRSAIGRSPLETSDNPHVVTEYQRGFDDGFKRATEGVRAVKASDLREMHERRAAEKGWPSPVKPSDEPSARYIGVNYQRDDGPCNFEFQISPAGNRCLNCGWLVGNHKRSEKASETLGEELARKSVETFEAEKASGKVGMHPQCREPNNCQADQNGYCAGCHAATYP